MKDIKRDAQSLIFIKSLQFVLNKYIFRSFQIWSQCWHVERWLTSPIATQESPSCWTWWGQSTRSCPSTVQVPDSWADSIYTRSPIKLSWQLGVHLGLIQELQLSRQVWRLIDTCVQTHVSEQRRVSLSWTMGFPPVRNNVTMNTFQTDLFPLLLIWKWKILG